MNRSGKVICHACHRPFNPASPGATATMGPTCAKRGVGEGEGQLSMIDGAEDWASPPVVARPMRHRRGPRTPVPARVEELYLQAKVAFDELYRLNCANGSLLYGAQAEAFDHKLSQRDLERHTLRDPLLDWLEPEQDFWLYVHYGDRQIQLFRVVNEVTSYVEIAFESHPAVMEHVRTIGAFTRVVREYRAAVDQIQLSLPGL